MGIKGIYKEIGPGDRISLCKLAVDTLEETGRPLRLAIDFSIWQFQVQAAKGGANPAIRTLFYRLVRLLGLAIHPIFVFDGPNKPTFKRNKRSSGRGDVVATAMGKHLIQLFGFAIHDAPGEAEAECALLQQQGVVDAVLSEDVDTIMFGCRKTLRNWSAEGSKGSKTPTHVSMYDAGAMVAGSSGLGREEMVLVALMSGGDYLPDGVPGCGVKVACEAARAGFGRELCRIKRADTDGLAAWKRKLLHELRTNESGFFRTRHKALEIPETFPNMEVLRYYTHPVVSQEGTVERLKTQFPPAGTVDIVGLREFSRETFDWDFKVGAVKFIRVLAPSLLVQQFLDRYLSLKSHHDDLGLKEKEESALVRAISSKRAHFSTDATPELRISFVPANIVKLDLDKEPEEEMEAFGRSGIALNSDDEFEEAEELDAEQPKSSSARKPFDPLEPELVWIPETLAKLGIPLTVEDWEGKQRLKEQRVAAKGTRKTRAKKTDMPAGALDKYVKVTKNAADSATKGAPRLELASSPPRISSQCGPPAPKGRSKQSKKTSTSSQAKPPADVNPWTLASSHASPRAPRPLPPPASQAQPKPSSASDPIVLSSSPAAPASPAARSAGVRCGQTTPTRSKRASPPIEDAPSPAPLFSPSPSPRKEWFPVPDEPAEEEPCAAEAQPRKARLFKRVKSGAADTAKVSTTQKSLKDFGRVMKSTTSSRINAKGAVPDTQPIEILSDDEEFPLSLLKQAPARAPKIFSQRAVSPPSDRSSFVGDDDPFASPPPVRARAPPKNSADAPVGVVPPPLRDDFGIIGDDDPFASPPPVRRRTPTPKPPANAPASLTKTNRGQQQDAADGPDTPKDDPIATTTAKAATAKSATTKLYVPRTSLGGVGYFKEIEVRRDDADRVLAEHNRSSVETGKRQGRRAWRRSEIQVFDLTGED